MNALRLCDAGGRKDDMPDPKQLDAVAVAGALATNYARDARSFLPLLAVVMEGAMPEDTEVERKGALFSKEKHVRKVTINSGQYVYTIEDPGNGRLAAMRVQTVRGIILKREEMHIDAWLAALAADITEHAKTNERAFFALQNMVELR